MTPDAQLDDCLVCVAFNAPKPRKPRAGYTCGRCLGQMRDQLKDLPELYLWAARELSPGSASGERGSERSIGVRVGALDLRWGGDLISRLMNWCHIWREDFGLVLWVEPWTNASDPVGATLVEVCRFLDANLARASESHPGIDVFAQELAALYGQATSAARTRPRQAWVVSCPTDADGGRCGSSLRVTGEDFGSSVVCKSCHTSWDVMRLLHVCIHDAASTLWLPASEIALLYSVPESTLRLWLTAGEVRREHGRYDVGSVRSAMLGRTRTRRGLGA